MVSEQTWRLERARIGVVEPVRGGGARYRIASTAGLVRPIASRFGAARLRLGGGGVLTVLGTVVGAMEDEPVVLTGRWHRDGAELVLAAAIGVPGGAWRTFDGRIVAGVLHAVLVDGFTATVAHLVADLVADPGAVAPPVRSAAQVGLPNARPVAALDVDFPVYDLELHPLDRFPDARPHRAALHVVPSADGRFAMSLTSRDATLPGSLHWSGDGLRRDAHVRGSRIHLRWPDASGEQPRWLSEGRPLDLAELDLEIDFDPSAHRVSGEIRGRTAAGERARATFTGVLRGRAVQRLRERITFPDCSGDWVSVIGGNDQLTVQRERSAEPPVLDLPDGRLRFVPPLDLLVGLRTVTGGSSELLVLRRGAPEVLDLPDDLESRQDLRFLGQDLCTAGRFVEARPVLDHVAQLIERAVAEIGSGLGAAESEAISLVMLLNSQVRCAFLLRDHPALLRHLERAVVLREELSDERYARGWAGSVSHTVGSASGVVGEVLGTARALLGAATRANHAVAAPAAALVERLEEATAILSAVAHTAATADPDLAAAIRALDRALDRSVAPLRALADRCLDDPAGLYAGIPEQVRERERVVEVVDGDAVLHPAELAGWEQRELRLEQRVREEMPVPEAELFVLQKDAATAALMASNLVAISRPFLQRADPVGTLAQRRGQNSDAASRLSDYIERWRHLLDTDWDRILAVEQSGSFYQRLVGMLLDLGAPEEAWVASELARARATADLLGASPPDGLDLTALRHAVAELGQTVVEYFIRGVELVAWVIAPHSPTRCVRHPVAAEQLTGAVRRVHELMALHEPHPQDCAELTTTLRWLGAQLWDPLPADALAPGQAVTIVPHRELSLVPFAGLTTAAGHTLLEGHTLAVLPAVALVPALVERGRAKAFGGPLLALVDPEPMPGDGLSQLTWTRRHFAAVGDLFPPGSSTVWVGGEASLDHLVTPQHPPTVVVLATHAEVQDAAVFVALAPTPVHDGRVTPPELLDLGLPGSVVILSACHTGSGRATNDGVDGLSRAFLVGGAATLVMTLHEVTEDAALDLAEQHPEDPRCGSPSRSTGSADDRQEGQHSEQHADRGPAPEAHRRRGARA